MATQNTPLSIPSSIVVDGRVRPVIDSNGKQIASTMEALENFWKWFGDSKVVDDKGRPLALYHGTAANFDSFSMERNRSELNDGFQGDGFHFSPDEKVATRYAFANRNQLIRKADIYPVLEKKFPPNITNLFKNVVERGYFTAWKITDDEIRQIISDSQEIGIDINDLMDIAEVVEGSRYNDDDESNLDPGAVFNSIFGGSSSQLLSTYHIDDMVKMGLSEAIPNEAVMPVYLKADNVLVTSDREAAKKAQEMGYDGLFYRGEGLVNDVPEWVVYEPNQIKSSIGNNGQFNPEAPGILFSHSGSLRSEKKPDGKTVYYHGTLANNIQRFRASGSSNILGAGVYLTDSPEDAAKYASNDISVNPDIVGKAENLAKELDISYQEAKEVVQTGSPVIYPVIIEEGNRISVTNRGLELNGQPIDFSNEKHQRNFLFSMRQSGVAEPERALKLYRLLTDHPMTFARRGEYGLAKRSKEIQEKGDIARQLVDVLGPGIREIALTYNAESILMSDGSAPLANGANHLVVLNPNIIRFGLDDTSRNQQRLLFSFAGTTAKTADRLKLNEAQDLLLKGSDSQTIWKETGWFRGIDGKWRFEIDNSNAQVKLIPNDAGEVVKNLPLSEVIAHDALFEAYPSLKGLKAFIMVSPEIEEPSGSFRQGKFRIEVAAKSISEARSVILHEIQHAIQEIERFARGGRPEEFAAIDITEDMVRPFDIKIRELMELYPESAKLYREKNRRFIEISDKYGETTSKGERLNWEDVPENVREEYFALLDEIDSDENASEMVNLDFDRQSIFHQENALSPFEQYFKQAGEVEARNVQKRIDMTATERLASVPSETEDVAQNDQMVRFYGSSPQNSILNENMKSQSEGEREFNKKAIGRLRKEINQLTGNLENNYTPAPPPIPHEIKRALENMFGRKIVGFEAQSGFHFNGAIFKESSDAIYINIKSDKPLLTVIGHEFLHGLRQDAPDIYETTAEALTEIGGVEGLKRYQEDLDELILNKTGHVSTNDLAREEFVADILGDHFTQPEFWEKVANYMDELTPGHFSGMISRLRGYLNKVHTGLSALGSNKYLEDVDKVQDVVALAMAQYLAQRQNNSQDAEMTVSHMKARTGNKDAIENDSLVYSRNERPENRGGSTVSNKSEPSTNSVINSGESVNPSRQIESDNGEGSPAWEVAKAKGLDMSQEARMQRARAMGFDTDTVYYHGTGADFDAFNLDKSGSHSDTGMLGTGFYFSSKARVANDYARRGKNGNVIQAFLKVNNPFIVNDLNKDLPYIDTPSETMEDLENSAKAYSDGLREWAIDNGYDSIIRNMAGGKQEVVVFEPNQIRSINAAFNPDQASSGNILFSHKGTASSKRVATKKNERSENNSMDLQKSYPDDSQMGLFSHEESERKEDVLEVADFQTESDKKNRRLLLEERGMKFVSGLGLSQGKVIVSYQGELVPGRYDSLDDAKAAGSNYISSRPFYDLWVRSNVGYESNLRERLTNQEASVNEVLSHLGLSNQVELNSFVSEISRFFELNKRDVRPLIKKHIRVADTQEFVDSVSALESVQLINQKTLIERQDQTESKPHQEPNRSQGEVSPEVEAVQETEAQTGEQAIRTEFEKKQGVIGNPVVIEPEFNGVKKKLVAIGGKLPSLSQQRNGLKKPIRMMEIRPGKLLNDDDISLIADFYYLNGRDQLEVEDVRRATDADKKMWQDAGLELPAIKSKQEKAESDKSLIADNHVNSEPMTVTEKTDQENSAPGSLDDFGEKLGGARKDEARMRKLLNELSNESSIRSEPLSKLWPKDTAEKIERKDIAALAHILREEIPAKPRSPYKMDRWIKTVKSAHETLSEIQMDPDAFIAQMRKSAEADKTGLMAQFEILMETDKKHWGRIGKVRDFSDSVTYIEGESTPNPSMIVYVDGKAIHKEGATNYKDLLESVHSALEQEPAPKNVRGLPQFEIRYNKRQKIYFINKKGDSERNRLKTFGDDLKSARTFLRNNHDELVAAWEEIKDRKNVKRTDVRGDVNLPRIGVDYRDGKDVTPEMFLNTFGFRGVEFGNWVKQGKGNKERQGLLNDAYDAFMDLAHVLSIPTKAISLEGTLGLGFGSRGRGGKFAAHFEPGNKVINLTKTKGAGNLAHEWFHAFENYLSTKRDGEITEYRDGTRRRNAASLSYITYQPEAYMVNKDRPGLKVSLESLKQRHESQPESKLYQLENWEVDPEHPKGVRPIVESSFANLVTVLDSLEMKDRSKAINGGKEGYWSRIIERAARSFENYTISKLDESGYKNDFLANVVPAEAFPRDLDRYPYLLDEELEKVSEAFDNLYNTISHRQTENENIALFSYKDEEVVNDYVEVEQNEPKDISDLRTILARFHEVPRATVKARAEELPIPDDLRHGLEKAFGRRIVGFKGGENANEFNGLIVPGINDRIYIASDSTRPVMAIAGHELLHAIKEDDPELYDQTFQAMLPLIKNEWAYKDKLDKSRKEVDKPEVGFDILIEEIIADTLGDNFTNPVFWKKVGDNMGPQNGGFFSKLLTRAQGFLQKLKNVINPLKHNNYISDIDAAQDILAKTSAQHIESVLSKNSEPSTASSAWLALNDENPSKMIVHEGVSVRINSRNEFVLTSREGKKSVIKNEDEAKKAFIKLSEAAQSEPSRDRSENRKRPRPYM